MATAEDLARTILGAFPPPSKRDGDAPSPTVHDFLAQATAAHLRYRRAVTDRHADPTAVRDAAVARAQAELLDPTHADPAWQDSGGTHPFGIITHDGLQLELLQFYVQQLGLAEDRTDGQAHV